jgi:hypothetical protein
MGYDIFPHQYIFKNAFALDFFPQFLGRGPALEIMGVDNLTLAQIRFNQFRDFISDEFVESVYADAGFLFLFVFLVIADLIKIIAVVKYAYAQNVKYFIIHS